MARLDTSLESAGAEFLVLGNLLVEGIQAFKAYVNFPGYDIIATNPEGKRSCRIQVKSRWATDFDGGFPIRNFDCDFVILVALNRGYRYRRARSAASAGTSSPKLWVLPIDVVRAAQSPTSSWGKAFLRHMSNSDQYVDNWQLIKTFLGFAPHG